MNNFSEPEIKQLLERTGATAALILHKDAIVTKAGDFSTSGFQAFTDALIRYWLAPSVKRVKRYVGLPIDKHFFLVYAMFMPRTGALLGLTYPLPTPLASIRQGMLVFREIVFEKYPSNMGLSSGDSLEQSLQERQPSMPEPDSVSADTGIPPGWQAEMDAPVPIEEQSVPEEPINQPETEQETDDKVRGSLPHELRRKPEFAGSSPADSTQDPHADIEEHYWGPLDPSTPDVEDLASILQEDFITQNKTQADEDQAWSAGADSPAQINKSPSSEEEFAAPHREDELASLAKTVFDTTFYLVPRLNEHYLLGELAQQVRQWFPQLCEMYGWELNLLSIRPDYLKWTLVDFPECLTQGALAAVRNWTSKHIFEDFPALQAGNPSQDFWSPGYLVDTQNQEFPTQVLIANVSRSRSG